MVTSKIRQYEFEPLVGWDEEEQYIQESIREYSRDVKPNLDGKQLMLTGQREVFVETDDGLCYGFIHSNIHMKEQMELLADVLYWRRKIPDGWLRMFLRNPFRFW